MLVKDIFIWIIALTPLCTIAMLISEIRRDSASNACSPEGIVECSVTHYRTCASGVWSTSMLLAQGTTCDSFHDQSSSVTSFPSPTIDGLLKEPTNDPYNFQSRQSNISTTFVAQATVTSPSTPSTQVSSSSESISLHYYSGPASAFPTPSFWKSFDLLWTLNKGVCELNPDDTVQPIHDAITQVASESGVDARIIFTVILQESTCLLSAATTNNGVNNPGLMQSHNGVGYTNKASILQMIRDGTEGTFYKGVTGGDGLQQLITRYGIYGGLRAYNSGDLGLNASNLSSTNVGTPSYVSDVANRLTGAMIAH